MQRWIDRPEARWALWTGLAAGLAAAASSTVMIFSHGAAAAFSFVLVPFIAVFAAIPAGIWGAAVGHVVQHLRGVAREPRLVLWTALAAALALPLALACYLFSNIFL